MAAEEIDLICSCVAAVGGVRVLIKNAGHRHQIPAGPESAFGQILNEKHFISAGVNKFKEFHC
jgi:hypothetical protein